ncbi:hypothetical protein B0H11DRAFT_2228538 [Mycena galericulata]|nr:hypothetical protein B0H11DRAFT_2228538 [Mycena galericulata]
MAVFWTTPDEDPMHYIHDLLNPSDPIRQENPGRILHHRPPNPYINEYLWRPAPGESEDDYHTHMGENLWIYEQNSDRRIESTEWRNLWRLAEAPDHVLLRTNIAHINLQQVNVDLGLELEAVQDTVRLLTRNYERLAMAHEDLLAKYLAATADLGAAMQLLAQRQRELSRVRQGLSATTIVPVALPTPVDLPEDRADNYGA